MTYGTGENLQENDLFTPAIQLQNGINERSFVARKLHINVATAITGMARTVGNAISPLNMPTQKPSQRICIRYIP